MDYDDELNDDEEKQYRKDLIEKRKAERRERERLEREAAAQPKVLPKRATRGQRMNALVGKAIEEDEEFWNQGIFAEPDSDDDFASKDESSSQGRDSFDSDFDKGSSGAAASRSDKEERKKNVDDEDFDSEEERDALAKDHKEKKAKKSVQFNIKSNVERLRKQKQQ